MEITFDKYIDNPSGNAVISNKSMYKKMYQEKFDKILLRENGAITYYLYTGKENSEYFVYIKVPSEVVPNFYYDVVLRFYTNKNEFKDEGNLRRYFVEFFSNDPSFVYTFAHSFYENHIFVEDMKPKMSKQAIKKPAKVKNPKNEVWYVKSLYFAYLTMEKYHLFNKSLFRTANNASKYNKKELLNKITPADLKVQQRQEEGAKVQRSAEDRKKKSYKQTLLNPHTTNQSVLTKRTKTTATSRIVKSAKTTKKSKII